MKTNYECEYTPLYYGTPCQVKFYEPLGGTYLGGIAFHDNIICGCCGGIYEIDKVVKEASKEGIHWDQAIIELEWIDISDTIK